MKSKLAVLCVSVAMTGCANLSTVFRDRTMVRAGTQTMSNVVTMDANQRAIISTLSSNVDGSPLAIVCSEPPPDVMSALNTSLGATISASTSSDKQVQAAAQVAAAIATSVATIQRTQTVNLLALSMYRTCERYLNGALNGTEAAAQALRDQRAMVTILAIEQLTTLGSGRTGSSASVQSGMSDTLAAAKATADASKSKLDAANAKVASDVATAATAAAAPAAGAGAAAAAGGAVGGAGGAAAGGAGAAAGAVAGAPAEGAGGGAGATPAAADKQNAVVAGKGGSGAKAAAAPVAKSSSPCDAITGTLRTTCVTDQKAADDAKSASDRDEAYYQSQLKLANASGDGTAGGLTTAAQPFTEGEITTIADTVYRLAQLGVREDVMAVICEFPRAGTTTDQVEEQLLRQRACQEAVAAVNASGGQVAVTAEGEGALGGVGSSTLTPVKTFGPTGTFSGGVLPADLYIQVQTASQLPAANSVNTGVARAIPQLRRNKIQVMGASVTDFPATTDIRFYSVLDLPQAALLSQLIGTAEGASVGPRCIKPNVAGGRQGILELWINEIPAIDTAKASSGVHTAAPDPSCLTAPK